MDQDDHAGAAAAAASSAAPGGGDAGDDNNDGEFIEAGDVAAEFEVRFQPFLSYTPCNTGSVHELLHHNDYGIGHIITSGTAVS